MLGIILVSKGLHSGKEVNLGYPNSIYKEELTYFDSVHYNNSITASSSSKGWPSNVIAELLCPKKERWNKILDFSAESIRFIGYPVSVGQKTRNLRAFKSSSITYLSQDTDLSAKLKENISAFNVVLAFEVDSHLLLNVESIKEAIISLSILYLDQCLKFEQERCSFITSEIGKIRVIHENSANREEENSRIVEETRLGKELSMIYTDLCIHNECSVDINNWLRLNLLIKPQNFGIECLPFQTLLFKDNPKRLEPLIYDKSSTSVLNILIKRCKFPTVSFKDICEEEGISFEALKDGILHFVKWSKAKIITCLTFQSILVNNDNFVYNNSLVNEFEKIFKLKGKDLALILSFFSTPKKICEIEQGLLGKNKPFALITWLIRKGILKDLHYYLYLLTVRPMPKSKTFAEGTKIEDLSDNSQEFQTLTKIYKFCTGNTSVEEIIENTSESFEKIEACVTHFSRSLKMILL